MSISLLAAVAFTVCPCRRPTKKPATVPAVKLEQVSDVDLLPASQQPKGKAPARLESPIDISSDESGSDQLSDTPKQRPARYVIQFFGLCNFTFLSLQTPN